MTALILCILCTVALLVCFRLYETYGVNTFNAIVVNYMVCVITGLIGIDKTFLLSYSFSGQSWPVASTVLGAMFISTFYLIGLTTQRAGVTVASLANKMSMVLPVMISLWVFKTGTKDFNGLNYLGMGIALLAIVLSSYKKGQDTPAQNSRSGSSLLLPLAVFVMSGAIDTLINYSNARLLGQNKEEHALFSISLFGMAAVIGLVILLVRIFSGSSKFRLKDLVGGVALGVPNYFSLVFLLASLQAFDNDGAFMFPVLNIGIIIVSSLTAVFFFREKLSGLNWLGIGVAIMAIVLISYQEIFDYLSKHSS